MILNDQHTHTRFFFHMAYHGANYHGWQRQPGCISVQETLETVLASVLKQETPVFGCGRTDAGVHAIQYVFHADLVLPADFDLLHRLNHALPPDMVLFSIQPVAARAHARFDATRRTYDYFLHTNKNPFLTGRSAFYPDRNLNIQLMHEAVQLLPQYTDYYAFCKSPNQFAHTLCAVYSATLTVDPGGERLRFQICANRFLKGMIRIIMGRLLEVGTGKLSVSAFEAHLRDKKPPKMKTPAYPEGLYLSKIEYPYLEFPQRTDLAAVYQHDEAGYWRNVGSE